MVNVQGNSLIGKKTLFFSDDLGSNVIVEKNQTKKREALVNVVHLIQIVSMMTFENANKKLFLDYEGNIKLAKAIWEVLIREILKMTCG